ncbi:hypothetical protein FQN49_000832 [Arthroderma sp. PD_2]|nr:hypothetical protein FQN49_000832 [Arthroderma sp. PD_2]
MGSEKNRLPEEKTAEAISGITISYIPKSNKITSLKPPLLGNANDTIDTSSAMASGGGHTDGPRRKDWILLAVSLPLMWHNIYRMLQICQRSQNWETFSTDDKVNVIWGAITMIFIVAILSIFSIILLRVPILNRA